MSDMNRNTVPAHAPSVEEDTTWRDAVDRLGTVLDDAQAGDPARLSSSLRTDPARTGLQAILAQLDPARLLPILHWLAIAGLPDKREVLEALLDADPSGSGQALRTTLQAMHRRELLARTFDPGRVQALRSACRPRAQERA